MIISSCADAGLIISENNLPTVVEKVRIGSPAHYAGVEKGDKILDGVIKKDHITIIIERKGKKYGIKLGTVNKGLKKPPAKKEKKAEKEKKKQKSANKGKPHYIDNKIENISKKKALQVLSKWKIVLIIDKSGSMGHKIKGNKTTRWQWCRASIANFANEAKAVGVEDLDIILFNSTHSFYKNYPVESVERVFYRANPGGGTNLSKPLEFVFSDYAKSAIKTKPLLIAIITDGFFNSGAPIEEIVIKGVNKIPKNKDVALTFFEISGYNSRDTSEYFYILDEELVSLGAKRDIVDTMYFSEIEPLGLALALARAISLDKPERKRPEGVRQERKPKDIREKIELLQKRLKKEYE